MGDPILKPKQGIILISEPSLRDFYFRQSIVLLAEHNEEGSFGVIVNKPIEAQVSDIIKDFPDFDLPVYLGGPVKTDSIFFIHTARNVEQSLKIIDGLFWGGNIETIKQMLQENKLSEDGIRFFIGYSGWDPKQLDREIEEKSWVLSNANISEIINKHPENLWSQHLKHMGNDYAIWANFPTDPTFN